MNGSKGDQYKVAIGNREWMHRNFITVTENIDEELGAREELGQTAVLVAINGRILSTADTSGSQLLFLLFDCVCLHL